MIVFIQTFCKHFSSCREIQSRYRTSTNRSESVDVRYASCDFLAKSYKADSHIDQPKGIGRCASCDFRATVDGNLMLPKQRILQSKTNVCESLCSHELLFRWCEYWIWAISSEKTCPNGRSPTRSYYRIVVWGAYSYKADIVHRPTDRNRSVHGLERRPLTRPGDAPLARPDAVLAHRPAERNRSMYDKRASPTILETTLKMTTNNIACIATYERCDVLVFCDAMIFCNNFRLLKRRFWKMELTML